MQRSKKNANQLLIRQLSHLWLIVLVACQSPQDEQVEQVSDNSGYTNFTTEHQIIGYLGSRYLVNLVYRQTDEGPKLVGWGRKPITEWSVGSAYDQQVVEAHPDHQTEDVRWTWMKTVKMRLS